MAPVNMAHIFLWSQKIQTFLSQSANGQMGIMERKQEGHFVHSKHFCGGSAEFIST